jgi:ribosomal-protein-alanine N-acetyltransferase
MPTMATPAVLSFRPAISEDRSRLANLLHFETFVHRHLDWRQPLDWLGKDPYLVMDSAGRLSAALACPPDPEQIAWIRLFAVMTRLDVGEAWSALWPTAKQQLQAMGVEEVAAIALQDWFRDLVAASQFQHSDNVVVLDWAPGSKAASKHSKKMEIRPIRENDVPQVHEVDRSAFAPLWQNSRDAIRLALKQSSSATLIKLDGQVAAYQISTLGSQGLHLARLATHPNFQGQGLAMELVRDLQQQVINRGNRRLSVNTQEKNIPSLSLYSKLGFNRTSEEFPVYQLSLGSGVQNGRSKG